MTSCAAEAFREIALSQIGQIYARLRLVHPRAESGMVDSLRQFGQIFPVVVVPVGEGYELVDGFKRLRALKQLGYEHVRARIVELGVPSLKAAMARLKAASSGRLPMSMFRSIPNPRTIGTSNPNPWKWDWMLRFRPSR